MLLLGIKKKKEREKKIFVVIFFVEVQYYRRKIMIHLIFGFILIIINCRNLMYDMK